MSLAFVLMFCLYMAFAMFDYQGGIANFVGIALFQPAFAVFLSLLTILLSFILGLPLRLNRKINRWWRRNFYISIALVMIGLGLCAASVNNNFVEETTYKIEGVERTDTIPNRALSILGWFAVAIGTLHTYPPLSLR